MLERLACALKVLLAYGRQSRISGVNSGSNTDSWLPTSTERTSSKIGGSGVAAKTAVEHSYAGMHELLMSTIVLENKS